MAKKGEKKSEKRLVTAKTSRLLRKKNKWAAKTRCGTHRKKDSVSLAYVLRDILGAASNAREVKRILHEGAVKVNGKARRDKNFSVGLFDVLSIEKENKNYLAVYDSKRRIELKETGKEHATFRLAKAEFKRAAKKGKIQVTASDGTTVFQGKGKISGGDTIKLKLPDNKVLGVYPLEKNARAFISGGRHTAAVGNVKEIIPGTARREKMFEVRQGKNSFRVSAKNIMAIGEEYKKVKGGIGNEESG